MYSSSGLILVVVDFEVNNWTPIREMYVIKYIISFHKVFHT